MPIYAYECSQCGLRKDVLQKISDPPLTVCPQCKATALHKQLSAPSFQLKGTGWYATDFKNSGKPPAKSTAGADKAGADGATAGSKSEVGETTTGKPAGQVQDTGNSVTTGPA